MSSNTPSAVPDTSYTCPVAADTLSDVVLVAASPVVQAVIDSVQVLQPPISLSPPKAKSTKPASNPSYQTRWEREKAKAIQDGVDIEHTSGRRGAGDPQAIGPWIMGEMLGKGASGMWFSRHPSQMCVVLGGISLSLFLVEEERHIFLLMTEFGMVDSECGARVLYPFPAILLPFHRCCLLLSHSFWWILELVFLTIPHAFNSFARSRQTRAALSFWQACRRQDS